MWIYAVLKVTNSGSHWTVKLCIQIGWLQQKLLKFLFYSHNCTLACGAVFHSVCQVWLSSGPPEFFSLSYCAWLWNWPVEQSSILSAKFDCPVAHQTFSLWLLHMIVKLASGAVFHSVCQVWLSSGSPDLFTLATAHDCETGLLFNLVHYDFKGNECEIYPIGQIKL